MLMVVLQVLPYLYLLYVPFTFLMFAPSHPRRPQSRPAMP